jgi:hypothetical protein
MNHDEGLRTIEVRGVIGTDTRDLRWRERWRVRRVAQLVEDGSTERGSDFRGCAGGGLVPAIARGAGETGFNGKGTYGVERA